MSCSAFLEAPTFLRFHPGDFGVKNLVNVLGVTVGLPLAFPLFVSEWTEKAGGDDANVEFGECWRALLEMVGGLDGCEDIVLNFGSQL